jgi:hypothetical protein
MKERKNMLRVPWLVPLIALIVSSPTHAFFWGLDSYEECYANEMKDRPLGQASSIRNLCRKKFPKLSSFVESGYTGELHCEGFFPDPPIWTLKVSAKKLTLAHLPNLPLAIKRRNSESLFAEDPEIPLSMRVSFLTGEGTAWAAKATSFYFTCSEN